MRLEPYLRPELATIVASPRSRDEVLRGLAARASAIMPGVAHKLLYEGLRDREQKYPTCTPEGVAFPHVLLPEIQASVMAPCLLRPPVAWSPLHPTPQDIIFAMFGNAERPWEHVRMLARLARIARGPGALARLRAAATAAELHHVLAEEDRSYA